MRSNLNFLSFTFDVHFAIFQRLLSTLASRFLLPIQFYVAEKSMSYNSFLKPYELIVRVDSTASLSTHFQKMNILIFSVYMCYLFYNSPCHV